MTIEIVSLAAVIVAFMGTLIVCALADNNRWALPGMFLIIVVCAIACAATWIKFVNHPGLYMHRPLLWTMVFVFCGWSSLDLPSITDPDTDSE